MYFPECVAPAGDSRCSVKNVGVETNLVRYYYFYHSNQTENKKRMEIKWRNSFVVNLCPMLMYWKQVIVTVLKKKKDWIEQPIVLPPTKLNPGAPSCWDHFRGEAYYMPWVK